MRLRRVVLDVVVLLPRSRLGELRVLPWTSVGELAAALALARTTKVLWQVLSRYLREQLLLVRAAEDVDLGDGDGVKELLDDAEDAAEAPWCVDEVQLAETLWVVVLRNTGRLSDIAVDGRDVGQTDALKVHDCAASLEEVARFARAGGQTWVRDLLVLNDEVLEHALFRGDLVHGVQINLAKLLDVERTSILEIMVSICIFSSPSNSGLCMREPCLFCGSIVGSI